MRQRIDAFIGVGGKRQWAMPMETLVLPFSQWAPKLLRNTITRKGGRGRGREREGEGGIKKLL